MTPLVPHVPPFSLEPVPGMGYFILRDATGRSIAQGDRETCEMAARGEGLIRRVGDLFDADR